MAIIRESKTSIHFGIQFLLAGVVLPDRQTILEFEKRLLEAGVEFSQRSARPNGFSLIRQEGSGLQVSLETAGPQVLQLQIVAANPQCDLEMFGRDADAVTESYQKISRTHPLQVLTTSVCLRHLYSVQGHAFQYLWEKRLGQSKDDFKSLAGRPVAGGGLRLVLPAHQIGEQEPASIELRMESFMREPDKMFIEIVHGWPRPRTIGQGQGFDSSRYLIMTEEFAANEVWNFLVCQK